MSKYRATIRGEIEVFLGILERGLAATAELEDVDAVLAEAEAVHRLGVILQRILASLPPESPELN